MKKPESTFWSMLNTFIIVIFGLLTTALTATALVSETWKVMILDLHYDKGKITLTDKIIKYGHSPDRVLQPEKGYRLEIVGANDILLYSFLFEPPIEVYADISDPQTGLLSGGLIRRDVFDFALTVPYFEESEYVRIFDPYNEKIFELKIEKEEKKGLIGYGIWIVLLIIIGVIGYIAYHLKKRKK